MNFFAYFIVNINYFIGFVEISATVIDLTPGITHFRHKCGFFITLNQYNSQKALNLSKMSEVCIIYKIKLKHTDLVTT